MRKTLLIVAAGLLGMALFVQWHGTRAAGVERVSGSQIYIHGTPVCVFRHGQGIIARVGECDAAAETRENGETENRPFDARPGMNLPPGHPPIGPETDPESPRRVLI